MSDKMVPINIRPGVRLPHNIEGVEVVAADMLVDRTTKRRLMTLRPSLFLKNDPDWPKKVKEVVVMETPFLVVGTKEETAEEPLPPVEEKTAVEEKPKGKGKKSEPDHPA